MRPFNLSSLLPPSVIARLAEICASSNAGQCSALLPGVEDCGFETSLDVCVLMVE